MKSAPVPVGGPNTTLLGSEIDFDLLRFHFLLVMGPDVKKKAGGVMENEGV
jgi:hypothetical protein